MDCPIFNRDKGLDLPFSLDDEAERHRLNTTCREAATHLLPQNRADAVTHETVQHAARLLGIDQVHVDAAWIGKSLVDSRLRDLMELHALGALRFDFRGFDQMPRN